MIRSTIRQVFHKLWSPSDVHLPGRRGLLQGLLTGGVATAVGSATTAQAEGGDGSYVTKASGFSIINLGTYSISADGYGRLEEPSPLTGLVRRLLLRTEMRDSGDMMFIGVTIAGESVNGVAHPTKEELAWQNGNGRQWVQKKDEKGNYRGGEWEGETQPCPGRERFPQAPIDLLREIVINRPIYEGEVIKVSLFNADAGSGHLVSGLAEVETDG